VADLNPYPIDDVVAMAEQTGYTIDELRSPTFTDPLLDAKMGEYYAGSLGQIVNPGQGTRSELDVFLDSFVEGVSGDVAEVGIGIAETTRNLGESVVAVSEGVLEFAKSTPLILAGAAVVLALVYLPKAG
jgi:hypothetical protein